VGGFVFLGRNLAANMAKSGITPGFGFLWQPANFAIGESLISFQPQDSYGRAILVGLLNTLLVSFLGCIFATVLGIVLGVARLSTNPVIAALVRGYVELFRNTPLLLQLFFWSALAKALPAVKQALEPLPGFYLSNRGFNFPGISSEGNLVSVIFLAASITAVAAWFVASRLLRDVPRVRLRVHAGVIAAFVLSLLAFGALGEFSLSWPAKHGFNITEGSSWSPEFSVLVFGLVINAAAGIAEIVRGGIEAVASGQWEAGRSLGLTRTQIFRLIVLPQALRIVIPVLISSYLSLTKNSSLAVAIGYPDVVNILNTTANQAGHALEAIIIMMGIYLMVSLIVSLVLNLYNRNLAIVSRSMSWGEKWS